MRIRWTPAAAADLEHISNYLKDRHPPYRRPTIRKLYEAIRSLKESPPVAVSDARTEPESFCSLPCPISPCTA
ncbi:MAG: type II toxin-antitoxin system RelE/ParE family toxin [Acidobacteriales bacterium]|nr:type II toxin-antitoxin system RelE/ParE family toxin [Terriglobales bacterium]